MRNLFVIKLLQRIVFPFNFTLFYFFPLKPPFSILQPLNCRREGNYDLSGTKAGFTSFVDAISIYTGTSLLPAIAVHFLDVSSKG